MATLEKIRNRAGVLVAIFIGFALFAFILTDFLSGGSKLMQNSQQEVADIDGTTISIQEYQKNLDEMEEFTKLSSGRSSLDENTVYSLREQIWNQMVQDVIMGEKYDELGLSISGEELLDLVNGKNVHPTIRQMFTNPQTGVFDQAQVIAFLKNKKNDPRASFYWNILENQITRDQLLNKYKTLLKKGVYITTAQAQAEAAAKTTTVDFDFIVKSYSSIADSTINVTPSELESYYSKNIENYKQDPTRGIEYIAFEVTPSENDDKMALEVVEKSKERFASSETDAAQFVSLNSDIPFNDQYLSLADVPENLQEFVSIGKTDDVFGPYKEDNTYKITRIIGTEMLPDSVKARHILIQDGDKTAANKLADSLVNVLNKGGDFEKLARTYSKDNGSAINGGDLGWFKSGVMVKPFNDACFAGKKGEIVKVESQFGIHIINILDKGALSKKYKLATMGRKVTYSSHTYQNVYSEATKFAAYNTTAELFRSEAEKQNLRIIPSANIKKNDRNVGTLDSSRELVRWAFQAEEEDLSTIFDFGDKFVIAVLTKANDGEYKSLEQVENIIKREVIKEKKADLILAELNNQAKESESLSSLAQKASVTVQSANNINFSSYQVQGAGNEPALISLAVNSPEGEISNPVKGKNGVFVVKVTNRSSKEMNVEGEKAQYTSSNGYKVDYRAFESIKKSTDIEDNRSNFY